MMDTNSQPEVGVGPWPGGPESWPSDDVYDPQLLADGDRRNVEDRYRYWKMEAIIADIAAHALPFEIAIDNVPGSIPLEGHQLSARACLVFGEESSGLSEEMRAQCDEILHITQRGSTRSMNVGHAAAIAMWAWVIQHS